MVMKVHFLYWCINFTIFWCCKVTYYRITINAHEFIINLCIFFAPMEQKSEKIFLRIKGSYEPEINNNF